MAHWRTEVEATVLGKFTAGECRTHRDLAVVVLVLPQRKSALLCSWGINASVLIIHSIFMSIEYMGGSVYRSRKGSSSFHIRKRLVRDIFMCLYPRCVFPTLRLPCGGVQILESEGTKQAKINQAEGEKETIILKSEAARTDAINRATGAVPATSWPPAIQKVTLVNIQKHAHLHSPFGAKDDRTGRVVQ